MEHEHHHTIPNEISELHELTTREVALNILVAVGNNEVKAVLIGAMNADEIYTQSKTAALLRNIQGDRPGWNISRSTGFNYYGDTLQPIGLVAESVTSVNSREVIGYVKTEYGQSYGVALAGHLLDLSDKYKPSLLDFVGATHSSAVGHESGDLEYKKRAAETRMKILEFLAGLEPGTEVALTEIAENIAWDSNLLTLGDKYLIPMGKKDLFTYKLPDASTESIVFSVDQSEIPPTEGSLARSVYDYIATCTSPKTVREIAEITGLDLTHTRHIVYYLKGQGKLKGVNTSRTRNSSVILDNDQQKAIKAFVDIFHRLESEDPTFIPEGQQHMSRLLAQPDRIALLLAKAKASSAHSNHTNHVELIEYIMSIIAQNGTMRTHDIAVVLSEELGIQLSTNRVSQVLTKLKRANKVSDVITGSSKAWVVKSSEV